MARLRVLLPLFRYLALASFVFLLVSAGQCQILNVGDDTSTPIEGAGHDYLKMMSETVDPGSGSVSIRIQTPMAKGRGITLPFSFAYSSNGVEHVNPGTGGIGWQSNNSVLAQGGWSYSLPTISSSSWSTTSIGQQQQTITCYFVSYYVFQDPSAGRHNLGMGSAGWAQGASPATLCGTPVTSGGDQRYIASLLTADGDGSTNPAVTVSDEDGTVYNFANSGPNTGALPSSIEDRNGNIITAGSGSIYYYDTAGRPAIELSGFGPSGATNTLTVSGAQYQATWTTTSASYSVPNAEFNLPTGQECVSWPSVNATETVISSITLPNGGKYQFYYGTNPNGAAYNNPYGLLSEIDYPDGGWVRYTWTMNAASEPAIYTSLGLNGGSPQPNGCEFEYGKPVVATRTVGFVPGVTALTQTFSYTTTWNTAYASFGWTKKTTSVTTTDHIIGESALTAYTYSSGGTPNTSPYQGPGISATQVPLEQTIKYYDWGNTTTPLRTITKNWQDVFDLTLESTLNDEGQTSQTTYSYQSVGSLTQLVQKNEYDYGLTQLRQTNTNYQSFAATPIGGVIADKPCQVITYVDSGTSTRAAETDYYYDGGTTLCGTAGTQSVTTITGLATGTHDETNYGAGMTPPRGNLTQKTQWASTGTSPATTYTYDETGQVLSKIDPCGHATCSDMTGSSHTTNYYYTDSYTVLSGGANTSYTPSGKTNAYLTETQDALGHTEYFTYDYYNGQLTVLKDENSQSTKYLYNDPFSRPTQVNYPDGGLTTLAYNDSPYNASTPSPSVTTTKTVSSSVNVVSTVAFDGMGHTVETILSSDPDGPTYTKTAYYGMGQKLTVTNPYRSTSDPTYGTTLFLYDGIGRAISTQRQDGSTTSTSFSANSNTTAYCTTVADETGKVRESCTDGLGRLVYVEEPGTGATDGTPGTGTVTVSGSEQSTQINSCPGSYPPCYTTAYDYGSDFVTVDGGFEGSGYYSTYSTASTVAGEIASSLNSSSSPVTATASGATVTITSKATGTDSNYSISTSAQWDSSVFADPSFIACPASVTCSGQGVGSSALTGGTDPTFGSGPLVTQYQYDALNDLICAVQKGTDTTTFTTCASAKAAWRPRSFVYDSLMRVTSATNPESGTITYSYDANSNVSSKIAPKPNAGSTGTVTTNYSYDVLNRLTEKSYVNLTTPNALYGYDGTTLSGCSTALPSITNPTNLVGRRSAMCSGNSESSFSYDPMGRLLFEARLNTGSSTKTYTTGYTYFKEGSLNTITYPSGDLVTYLVGGADRATQVTDSVSNYAVSAKYAPHGALASMTNGTGIVTSNVYNDRLQPVQLSASEGSSAIFSLCYDFHLGVAVSTTNCSFNAYTTGNNGNVFQVIDNVDTTRSAVFTYDPLNRILQANTINTTSTNCWGELYTTDAWGNLTNRAAPSGIGGNCSTEGLSATATTQNQLSGIGVVYDAAGNVTNDGNGNQPTYDAENRILTDEGYTYSYDADGIRMEKASGSAGTMYWTGPSGEVLTESALSGTIDEEYVFFNGERIARIDRPSGTVHYYFSDYLQSASVVTSASGTVAEAYYYYPYGGMQSSTGSDPNHYKFTGKERDSESGLDNFGARYNASTMGRFMSADPLGGSLANPQTLNKYSYVINNPLRYTDPTGLYACADDKNGSHCASKQDQAFEKTLAGLRGKDGDVGRAAAAYGAVNEDNGVTVGFKDLSTKGENGTTTSTIGTDANGNLRANSDVTINSKVSGDDYAAAVGHEGSHVADAQDVVKSGLSGGLLEGQPIHAGMNITPYQSEQRAYGVTNAILSMQNQSRKFDCGANACTLGRDSGMPALLPGVIDQIVGHNPVYNQGGQPMSSTNQGPSVVNGVTPNTTVPH
jgi:RHS repeat-associated protein